MLLLRIFLQFTQSMSFLGHPTGTKSGDGRPPGKEDKDELLVFGYAKAIAEDSGVYLIPWMGDHSLMIDRLVVSVFSGCLYSTMKYRCIDLVYSKV